MPLAGHLLWGFFGSCDIVRPEPGDLYKGGLEYPCYINWEIWGIGYMRCLELYQFLNHWHPTRSCINRVYMGYTFLEVKVKVQIYSLISCLKTHISRLCILCRQLHQLILMSFQLYRDYTVLQPFWRNKCIVHIVIFVLYLVLIYTWVKWIMWA